MHLNFIGIVLYEKIRDEKVVDCEIKLHYERLEMTDFPGGTPSFVMVEICVRRMREVL